jgi:predicted DsbA family dithiol-disulfide isomerase
LSAGAQDAVVEALFAAYFTHGRDIGDPMVLADIAEAAGMERLVVLQLLSEGADKESVSREHAMAVQGGVTGVPFVIFAGKIAVVGAETPERIVEAIDQAAASA